ncbi:MAG: PQQ-binding-like beta-propeller repeat protein, partial [Bacillota bacterium]
MNSIWASRAVPAILAAMGAGALTLWIAVPSQYASLEKRVPDMDVGTATTQAVKVVTDLKGALVAGEGKPGELPGAWPGFRGPRLDAISTEQVPLIREWKSTGPAKLWSVTLGEGYAGAAVLNGRVYVLDYDETGRADVLRCMSLADGKDIWRRSYNIDIGRNHGISRTVPAVTDKYVITLGPKCHVVCADAQTGDFKWGIDLVREYRTTVPPWYAGQCPLIDGERVILAPGGSSLMIAVDCATGNVLWKAPNPRQWSMTHSSIAAMTFNGKRMYVYCGSGGVAGVSAETGAILWETTAWKVNMA